LFSADSPPKTLAWRGIWCGLVLMAYLGVGVLGLRLPAHETLVSLTLTAVFASSLLSSLLSSGMALAALVRWGLFLWPGLWGGAFVLALSCGASFFAAALCACAATVGPVWGAHLLRQHGLHIELDRRHDLKLYVLFGALFSSGVTATATTLTLALFQLADQGWAALPGGSEWAWSWICRWLTDAMGALMIGIPVLTARRPTFINARPHLQAVQNFTIFAATVMVGCWPFGNTPQADGSHLTPLLFLPHVMLGWLAARGGLFAAMACAAGISVGATWGTFQGVGPFSVSDAYSRVAMIWGYVGTLTVMPLMVSAWTGELSANEARWQIALDDSHIGVGEWDARSRRFSLSSRWLSMLGYTSQGFGNSASAVWSRVHDEDKAGLRALLDQLTHTASGIPTLSCRFLRADGTWAWFSGHATVAERGAHGRPLRVIITAQDVDAQRLAEERQQLSATLFQHLHEGLLITDANCRVLDANPTFSSITGYSLDDMRGTVPALMRRAVEGTTAAAQQAVMWDSLEASGTWRGEVVDKRRNGEICTLQVTISSVKGPSGSVRFHALALSDITEARLQRELLERQAHFDELTGLPNRARLAKMLSQAMQASERDGSLLTVCYLDLDHFKPVNDQFGHEVGDRLLVDLADRLRRSLRGHAEWPDTVARLGGDEFVLLLRTATIEESRHAVDRVLRSVSQPYNLGIGNGMVNITASIGATVFPMDHADADTLMRHADHAMYGAKQSGRNGYLFFDPESDRRTEARFEALGRVQEALDAQEFVLYYQPKVDMRKGQVLGFEALLRWKHPQHGIVAPATFLPLIEHTGLSASVGDWVLQRGLEQLSQWQSEGLNVTLSVNISARHLQEANFAQRLAMLLAQHPPEVSTHLIIEVLETAALADVEHTCELMRSCQALGVRFALDDFGTGYSTLTYLKRLPLDLLKIDRSFVHNMLGDAQDLAIVEGVIGLSKTFRCTVVAEGVETNAQAQRLIEMGCFVGQGNGIAKAMPLSELAPWMSQYTSRQVNAEGPTWAVTN
jgi:diguanylate cyclase (GGDEF)-like protein/PAS domain S-box-containing protein